MIIIMLMIKVKVVVGTDVTFFLPIYKDVNGNQTKLDLSDFDTIEVNLTGENGIDKLLSYSLTDEELSIEELGILKLELPKLDSFKLGVETNKDIYYEVVLTLSDKRGVANATYLATFVKQASSTL